MPPLLAPVALVGWALLLTLWLLRRQGVGGRAFGAAAATVVAYFWLASPLGANLMVRAIEGDPTEPGACIGLAEDDVVVALAGGITASTGGAPPLARLKEASFRRTIAAAGLVAPHGDMTLIVSGGAGGATTEARLMRDLAVALGVSPERVVVEAESRSTRESAARLGELARSTSVSSVHLVTSALHMPRAAWALSDRGLQVCRHPVDWKQVPFDFPGWLVPQVSAIEKSTRVVHEAAGMVWYRLLGVLSPED